MSDSQVLEYVKDGIKQGKEQKQLASELARKGVTKEQAMRVKQLYEQQNNVNASNATGTDVNESRLREEMKENTSDMLEDHPSTQDLARGNQVFGRNIFNTRNLTFEPSVNLATPSNYRLGPGDEVIIDIWGASQNTIRQQISPDGTINIQKIGPVNLNGLTISEANDYLKKTLNKIYNGLNNTNDHKPANGSGCGNETASDRAMMRKYMVESVLYWINEYHIDGFRFDLMGIHDIETMNEIRAAVDKIDPSIFIYGEGWAASAPQLDQEELAMKANIYKMPRIAAFSDEMRDGLRGGWDDDRKGAFLIGQPGHEMSIKFGLVGAVKHPQVINDSVNYSKEPWALQPTQMISYVSCHDDMCLADRLKATMPDATDEERASLHKLAETFVFTSQGVPFIFAGDEMMRDKKGIHNSYNSPDSINTIDWRNKTIHHDVFDYVRELITLRKNHPAFRMGDADKVRQYMEFLPVEGSNLVAFILKDNANGDSWKNIIVAFNSRKEPAKLSIPAGRYTIVCKDGKIKQSGMGQVSGNEIIVPARSAMIIHQ